MRRSTFSRTMMSISLVVVACFFLALLTPALYAQTTSTIEGRVTDQQGAAIPGAEVTITSPSLAITRQVSTDTTGAYRISGLPAGVYSLTVSKPGFGRYRLNDIEVTLNRTVTLDASLKVASVATEISVEGGAVPLLEPTAVSSNATITPTQISTMPLNGRNYLDLMQLVPGVAVNRQVDPTDDAATPILGERGGNANFLIDGMPNSDQFQGGAASPFNQESILEFQVITAGYKAEFGRASGGVVNVLSKSGTNEWHGGASFFHRNYKLDSSDVASTMSQLQGTPFLLRWDPSFQFGGPIVKDKVFFFGSAERIRESRVLNSQFPTGTPDLLKTMEAAYNQHNQTYETRTRAKLDEQLGHHRLSQQLSWSNSQIQNFLPLSAYISLNSQQSNIDARYLLLGFNDVVTLGSQDNPFLLTVFGQYRGAPALTQAAHPKAGFDTLDNIFSDYSTGGLFGDVSQVEFGYRYTPSLIDQKYTSFGANMAKHWNRHDIKFGWDFQRMVVDGNERATLYNQLFATQADFEEFGPVNSGTYLLLSEQGMTPKDATIAIRNNYTGLFVQDDIRLAQNFTLSAGVRWDYDSSFPTNGTFSPRVGVAWAITPKTIVRGSYGLFYDHFRLGQARDVPAFGGANLSGVYDVGFPRLFYGNPGIWLQLFSAAYNTPCVANNQTDAQIAGGGCPFNPDLPFWGIDHLNSVVAAGHAPIPANAVVTKDNIQQLSGLSPDQFATAAAAAIGKPAGYFVWNIFGNLASDTAIWSPWSVPATVDPGFKTPYTQGYQFGLQRELASNLVVTVDYFHKDIRDILGLRYTNLAFDARLKGHAGALQPDTGDQKIAGYGPWYSGAYDGIVLSVRKAISRRFTLEGSYSWANETDDVTAYSGTGTNLPSDSFVGLVPVVTEPAATGHCGHTTALTNANGPFTAANCNPVPQAGKFYNGPSLDKGNSDLSLKHTFLLSGLLQLPGKFELSGIWRVQSGFHYSRGSQDSLDIDGDSFFVGIDHCLTPTDPTANPPVFGCNTTPNGTLARNAFTAPTFKNVDMRVGKRFDFTERARLNLYFEMFNIFNTANPAAVEGTYGLPTSLFGSVKNVLPGREGQVGLRIEF